MEKTYKVEVDITQRSHGAWDWQDSEFEIMNVKEVSEDE